MYQETTHKLMIFRNALKETTKPNDSLSQRPKTSTGPKRDSPPNGTSSNNANNKSSSSSSSLNSAKNMIDSRNIKSSTPTLIRTNPNYFSNRRSSNPNLNTNNNNNEDNYIEYSSNDETLSENDMDDRLNLENENIIEDDDEIIINFSSNNNNNNRKSPKVNKKIYMKPEIYLTTSDNENEVDAEQSSEQPSIQTIIENHNLIT